LVDAFAANAAADTNITSIKEEAAAAAAAAAFQGWKRADGCSTKTEE
jgi:hypothetical protein